MDTHETDGIRDFLLLYTVRGPREELVRRTKRLMRDEMAKALADLSWQGGWLFVLLTISLVMSLCIFYMLTVGTILTFTLPPYMYYLLRQSIFAFTAVGGCFLAGLFMVFFFKQFEYSRAQAQ